MQCKAKRNHDERQGAGGPQPLYYSYFKKTGHIKVNCFKKNRRAERNGGGNDYGKTRAADDVFNSVSETSESSENIWIGDSGTSCHQYNSDQGLFDVKVVSERITVGNGKTMEAKMIEMQC